MEKPESKTQSPTSPPARKNIPPLGTSLKNTARRVLDLCASLAGLIVLAPLFLLLAILIKYDSPGPVFYRGARTGKKAHDFYILKFRTMFECPESYQGLKVTAQDDLRITRVGRWLRDTKLNELPQLWNVFKGEMSLVGPRPEDPEIAAGWPEEVRREVLSVRPGITSPASVLYRHEETLLQSKEVMSEYLREILPSKLRFDQLYIRNRTLLADLDVLFWTLLVMLPRLSGWNVPEHLLFWGPLSRFINRIFIWFLVDFLVSFAAVAVTGMIWRLSAPLDLGVLTALGIALSIALLFSLINTLTGINRTYWSRASTRDGLGLAVSSGLVTAILFLFNLLLPNDPLLPPGLLVTAGIFSYFGFIAVRYRGRLLKGLLTGWVNLRTGGMRSLGERVLIVGSGEVGQFTTWLLKNGDLAQAFCITGIVDDDPREVGTRIDGCEVIGTTKDIPALVEKHDVGLIMYAISNIDPIEQQRILSLCYTTPASLVQVPDILDMLRAHFPSDEVEREQLNRKVLRNTTIDGLTGVYNQQYFLRLTERELCRARRYGHPLSILMLAVDCLKPDGAAHSSAANAQIVKTVAERFRKCTREIDIIGRYDDSVLVLTFPETSLPNAHLLTARLQRCLTDMPIRTEYLPICAAVRMSVVTTNGDDSDVTSLIESALIAMEADPIGTAIQRNLE